MQEMQNPTLPAYTHAHGRGRMAGLVVWGLLLVALSVGGCAKAKAASVPDGPPLVIPSVPSRVLAPVDEQPAVAENPPEPEPPAPPRTTTPRAATPPPRRPPTTAGSTPAEGESKPDAATQTPPAVAIEPPLTARPATPTDTAAERRIQARLKQASDDLGRVDYRKLSSDGQTQYDLSKRLNEQAQQELKNRNYQIATTLADKASDIARELLTVR